MITGAKFITSATNLKESPNFAFNEVAFLGRSNVGKSSLINALTQQKNLAKSSATPGKTRLINFFEVNFKLLNTQTQLASTNSLIFVDLPGFGYAKVSHAQRQEWDKNLDEFLKKRRTIKLFIHLIDARHENLALDEEINRYLQSFILPTQNIFKVFTKADKLNQSQKARLKNTFNEALLVSSAKKQGLKDLENELIKQGLGL